MNELTNKSAENTLRQIVLELPEYCDTDLEFNEMAIDAVKKAVKELKTLRERSVTDKMKEARRIVDDYIQEKGVRPSYRTVAELLGIKSTAAYHRLRGYRHKMARRQ